MKNYMYYAIKDRHDNLVCYPNNTGSDEVLGTFQYIKFYVKNNRLDEVRIVRLNQAEVARVKNKN